MPLSSASPASGLGERFRLVQSPWQGDDARQDSLR